MKLSNTLDSANVGTPPAKILLPDSEPVSPAEIRIARTIADVEAIRETWSAWRTHRDADIDFCLRYVWTGQEFIRPHVIVLYRYGKPDAMLVGRLEHAQTDYKIGYLRFPGIRVRLLSFAYRGMLGNLSVENSSELVKSIMDGLRQGEAEMAFLHQPSTDSHIYQKALSLAGPSRDHLTRPGARYLMRLPSEIKEAYSALSGTQRKRLRRNEEKLRARFQDDVEIRCFRQAKELDIVLPQVECIARETYQRGLGVGFENTELMYRRLRVCAERGWLRIYLLSLGGQPCAFWIGTVYGGGFCSDYTGFDTRFADYSLGSYLLTKMVEDFIKTGVEEIDFGPGQAEYKERFGNRRLLEASVCIFAPSMKGLMLNAVRTSTGLADGAVRKTLQRTNLLPKIKRFWRARLAKRIARE